MDANALTHPGFQPLYPGGQQHPARYLVCVDRRPESKVALRLACLKAKMRACAVDMLHVLPQVDFQSLGSVEERMREEQQQEGNELLQSLAAEAATLYGVAPHALLREGPTGDEILAAVTTDPHINVLVIGIAQQTTSGRGKLASWLAGQLGSKLFIPILMVPGNLTDQQLESLI